MAELKVSNFNLALFQEPKNPLSDEQFSEIYLKVLKDFPFVDQLSNPILTARRKVGGQISLNPAFLQFLGMEAKDFESDLKIIKDISSVYFPHYKTEKLKQIAIRLVSIVQARFINAERQLLINEDFRLNQETKENLNFGAEIKVGVRLVFQRNGKRYDLRIEPHFANLDQNYIDLNIVIPNPDKTPEYFLDFIYEEVNFLKEKISRLIP